MKTEIETLSKRRIFVMATLGLTYLFFQFFSLEFIAAWTGWAETTLNRLEDFGTLAFIAALGFLGVIVYKASKIGDVAKTELYDELVKDNANRTMIFSFKALFLLGMFLFIICQFVDIIGEDVARIMMTASFAAPYLRFAYLENRNA